MDAALLAKLIARAKRDFDGHLTILRFTTNWRVGFITPNNRADISALVVGTSFRDAAKAALAMSTQEHLTTREHWQKAFASYYEKRPREGPLRL